MSPSCGIDAHGLDAARFRKAWQAVLDRHAVLRSGFLADASLPLQWVARQVLLDITEHDCRHSEDVAGPWMPWPPGSSRPSTSASRR